MEGTALVGAVPFVLVANEREDRAMRTFNVSGTAMAVLADEVTPEVAGALTAAGAVRRGRGVSYEVTLLDVQADELRVLCRARGHELVTVEVDEQQRRAGRALLVVADSIEAAPVVREPEPGECRNGCGAPARGDAAPYYSDVCERWPLCDPAV